MMKELEVIKTKKRRALLRVKLEQARIKRAINFQYRKYIDYVANR
jgi:hypothetical protein